VVIIVLDILKQGWGFVDGLGEPWSSLLKLLLILIGAGYLGYKTIKFVPQDKKAIKLRFGKVVYKNGKPLLYEPGLHIIVPFTHSLEMVDSRERVIRLKTDTHSDFFVPYKDGKPGGIRVPASVTILPVDVHRWRYVSEDVENRVTDICVTDLQGPITSTDPLVILHNSTFVSAELYRSFNRQIDARLAWYGGKLISVNIGMCNVPDGQPLADAVSRMKAA
jgi:regulator of protease activity HflC (stomatin/prohibitin superfamily)